MSEEFIFHFHGIFSIYFLNDVGRWIQGRNERLESVDKRSFNKEQKWK